MYRVRSEDIISFATQFSRRSILCVAINVDTAKRFDTSHCAHCATSVSVTQANFNPRVLNTYWQVNTERVTGTTEAQPSV